MLALVAVLCLGAVVCSQVALSTDARATAINTAPANVSGQNVEARIARAVHKSYNALGKGVCRDLELQYKAFFRELVHLACDSRHEAKRWQNDLACHLVAILEDRISKPSRGDIQCTEHGVCKEQFEDVYDDFCAAWALCRNACTAKYWKRCEGIVAAVSCGIEGYIRILKLDVRCYVALRKELSACDYESTVVKLTNIITELPLLYALLRSTDICVLEAPGLGASQDSGLIGCIEKLCAAFIAMHKAVEEDFEWLSGPSGKENFLKLFARLAERFGQLPPIQRASLVPNFADLSTGVKTSAALESMRRKINRLRLVGEIFLYKLDQREKDSKRCGEEQGRKRCASDSLASETANRARKMVCGEH
ncbi:hypothetical protein PAPHI01_2270 [Pancytospora philotis]|nr:hypothetical protein PAPHI01_2270 [Pancytospora philotis]